MSKAQAKHQELSAHIKALELDLAKKELALIHATQLCEEVKASLQAFKLKREALTVRCRFCVAWAFLTDSGREPEGWLHANLPFEIEISFDVPNVTFFSQYACPQHTEELTGELAERTDQLLKLEKA